jgi:hypothetical protein
MGAHEGFVEAAGEFKRDLQAGGCFSPDEITAMLGSFVLCVYRQMFTSEMPPEMSEALVKTTLVNERMLAEGP